VGLVATLLRPVSFEPGAVIYRRGEPADALYFLVAGRVHVRVDFPLGDLPPPAAPAPADAADAAAPAADSDAGDGKGGGAAAAPVEEWECVRGRGEAFGEAGALDEGGRGRRLDSARAGPDEPVRALHPCKNDNDYMII
jgi:CRP-like cAMP-binding protein